MAPRIDYGTARYPRVTSKIGNRTIRGATPGDVLKSIAAIKSNRPTSRVSAARMVPRPTSGLAER